MPSVIAGLDEKPAVVRPRPEGEQSQALGTMLPRRLSTLMGVFAGFLGYNVNVGVGTFLCYFFSSLGGCLILIISFAVGVTCRFHFPMLLSRLFLLAA